MMPVIRISDATFTDLKSISAWFCTKTPSDTIDRAVSEVMERLGMGRDVEAEDATFIMSDGLMQFDITPGLAYTKLLEARIDNERVDNPNWATLLRGLITRVKIKGVTGEKLVRELAIPAKVQQYEKEGFTYYPDLGISVQGQSAADCWKEVNRLAEKWNIPVMAKFSWRQNPKAQYPGRTGMLSSGRV